MESNGNGFKMGGDSVSAAHVDVELLRLRQQRTTADTRPTGASPTTATRPPSPAPAAAPGTTRAASSRASRTRETSPSPRTSRRRRRPPPSATRTAASPLSRRCSNTRAPVGVWDRSWDRPWISPEPFTDIQDTHEFEDQPSMIDIFLSKAARPRTACLAAPLALLAVAANPGLAAAADVDAGTSVPTQAMPAESSTTAATPPGPEAPPPPAPTAQKAGQAAALAPPAPSQNRRPTLGMPSPARFRAPARPKCRPNTPGRPSGWRSARAPTPGRSRSSASSRPTTSPTRPAATTSRSASSLVARSDTYEGTVGRTQFTGEARVSASSWSLR